MTPTRTALAPSLKVAYRTTVLPTLSLSGCFDLLRWAQRDRGLILMYHGVVAPNIQHDPSLHPNDVDTDILFRQLEFVKKHYTVVPLQEIVVRLHRNASLRRLAAVTFDDGYWTVYKHAAPVLFDLRIQATVFIIAGLVGTGHSPWYDVVEQALLKYRGRTFQWNGHVWDLAASRREVIRQVKDTLKT